MKFADRQTQMLLSAFCSLFFVLAALQLVLLVAVKTNIGPSRYDRTWKKLKKTCETTTCGNMIPEESYNCVNKCISDIKIIHWKTAK